MRQNKNSNVLSPILKWAGGKRQLLDKLLPLVPNSIKVYCEPFVGGGAMLFALRPNMAYVNDINSDLINVYKIVRSNVDELISLLKECKNEEEYYYSIRNQDRDSVDYYALSDIEKAVRILYLNKTCFNGLYRVNKKGEFNTPFGRYKNPDIVNESGLKAVSSYLKSSDIHFSDGEYKKILEIIPSNENTFVYLDPPYYPISKTSDFTSYSKEGFTQRDQIQLKEQCDNLTSRDIKFMMSNSSVEFIRELYSEYSIMTISARRSVNSNPLGRGSVQELVIKNF